MARAFLIDRLEPRRMLCGVVEPPRLFGADTTQTAPERSAEAAAVQWAVSFWDPGSQNAAWYEPLTRVIRAAGADWAAVLDLPVSSTIAVQVAFPSNIATANGRSATTVFAGNDGSLDLFHRGAAAEMMSGIDPNGVVPDVEINIGRDYLKDELWFDPDPAARSAPVPVGRTDAYSVLLHELGHAIAYNGWRDWHTYQLPGAFASTFDAKVSVGGDGFAYFAGERTEQAYGAAAALTAGNLYHWGNPAPGPGGDLAPQLMNGIVFFRGTRHDLSTLDAAVLSDVRLPVDSTPPRVLDAAFDFERGHDVRLRFDESVRTGIDVDAMVVRRLSDGATFWPSSLGYDRATDTATFGFAPRLPDGEYRATLHADAVHDVAGNRDDDEFDFDFHILAGDANRDGRVDVADLGILATNWQQAGRVFSQGDFTYDGVVDVADLGILATNWQGTLPAAGLFARAPLIRPQVGQDRVLTALFADRAARSRRAGLAARVEAIL